LLNSLKIVPPGGVDQLKAFVGNKLAMWINGSWNITGFKENKTAYTAVHVPTFFKTPAVWAIGHEYTFPKQQKPDDAKTEAVWKFITFMIDNGATWTIEGGVLAANRKAYSDPRMVDDPVLKVLIDQSKDWHFGQATPAWLDAEAKLGPVQDAIFVGKQTAKDALPAVAKDIDASLS
jgi:ABC-type glycerol-3-phosphate transport system substrate-binding protein